MILLVEAFPPEYLEKVLEHALDVVAAVELNNEEAIDKASRQLRNVMLVYPKAREALRELQELNGDDILEDL